MPAMKTNELANAAEAFSEAAKALSADAVRQMADFAAAANAEALAAFEAVSTAANAKSIEDATKAGMEYWNASFARFVKRAQSTYEGFPERFAAISTPAAKASSALQSAFAAR